MSVANICHSFVPKYWDPKRKEWMMNPHGGGNSVLYIGTEMELTEEIEPILWSYIACVPTDHILQGKYEPGEEERVDEAIRILDEESNIYLEYVPEYNIGTLESIIDFYTSKYGIHHVFFDYIHVTTELIAEFQANAKAHIQVREDQILLNLGIKLKELCRKYNISIDTWTQVNGDAKNEQNRDASVIRGAKSLADKADICGVFSEVTPKELKMLDKVFRNARNFGKPKPNRCYSIYKNRGGKWTNIKIWLYINYGTMRVEDLFCTDYNYNMVDIEKTYTAIIEDKIISTTDKEEFRKKLKDAGEILKTGKEHLNKYRNKVIEEKKKKELEEELEEEREYEENNKIEEVDNTPDIPEDTEEENEEGSKKEETKKEETKKDKKELKNQPLQEEIKTQEKESESSQNYKELTDEEFEKELRELYSTARIINDDEEDIKKEKKQEEPPKKKRGRPKGSKNKPKSDVLKSPQKITDKTNKNTVVMQNKIDKSSDLKDITENIIKPKRRYYTGTRPKRPKKVNLNDKN